MSVLFFALSATSALVCTFFYEYTGDITDIFSTQKLPSYKESDTFYRLVYEYVNHTSYLSLDFTDEQIEKVMLSEKDKLIEPLVQDFLQKKAEIIRSELYYVATNYDTTYEDDYYYKAYNEYTTTTKPHDEYTEAVTEPVTSESSKIINTTKRDTFGETTSLEYNSSVVIEVDPYAPYNVRYCQLLLNTVSGLGFLDYENLVRDEALSDQTHFFSFSSEKFSYYANAYGISMAYDNSETEIREALEESYSSIINDVQIQYSYDMSTHKETLSSVKNYKYLFIDGDRVLSNIPENERTPQNIAHHDVYGIYKDGVLKTVGLDNNPYSLGTVLHNKSDGDYTLYFYIEDALTDSDCFYDAMAIYELYSELPPLAVPLTAILSLIAAIIFLIVLINLCGHKNGVDGTVLSFIDKVPHDIHFVIVAALTVCAVIGWIIAGDAMWMTFPKNRTSVFLFTALTAVLSAAAWALIAEWCTSFARLKKKGVSNSLIVRLFKLIKKLLVKLINLCKKGFRLVFYKNVKLTVFATIGAVAYFVINGILTLLLYWSLGWLFVMIPFNVAVLLLVLLFLQRLDQIIAASENIGSPVPNADKMPGALKELAENISLTNAHLQEAVEQTIKNERMKTDLITNVSHDLRTPLTAIISYVGLLDKCDIADPTAKEYLTILSEKSEKLKQLINDLIEASKVSSGNVTLNISELNLSELVVQAIVEATPEFEKNGLEIRFQEPDSAPIVLADSAKTYRIIENLLSNARKYSAENSRVYISVSENESTGVFEIKNISSEPLNIDADELMERFVRGDKSRSKDGNGLGLSIAKELCSAQNGRLSLSIDGDLFKATVYLPKKQ